MTTVQDFPGRCGYWDVGVPPSGPFDSRSFRLGNQLLRNPADAAGLEMTLSGPTLRFLSDTRIVLTGAHMSAELDGEEVSFWSVLKIRAGQQLAIGKISSSGSRAYLLIQGEFSALPICSQDQPLPSGSLAGMQAEPCAVETCCIFSPISRRAICQCLWSRELYYRRSQTTGRFG